MSEPFLQALSIILKQAWAQAGLDWGFWVLFNDMKTFIWSLCTIIMAYTLHCFQNVCYGVTLGKAYWDVPGLRKWCLGLISPPSFQEALCSGLCIILRVVCSHRWVELGTTKANASQSLADSIISVHAWKSWVTLQKPNVAFRNRNVSMWSCVLNALHSHLIRNPFLHGIFYSCLEFITNL